MDAGRLLAGLYRLVSMLGRGGSTTVWRAHDELLGHDIAIEKVPFPSGLSSAELCTLRGRTFREARAAARLSHPGIVAIRDVIEDSGGLFVVTDLVHGRSLEEILGEGALPPHRVAERSRPRTC